MVSRQHNAESNRLTLWKTMSARIRGASTELDQLGEETDEYTESTSKLRDLVMGLTGFDIMLDENTFKDIYEIILGIGKEWNNLTDIEQASLGEALAGKRNANALYAVLGNLDTLQDAYKTAEESAGSAMREQENYEKSIQYSIDRLNASVEEWSNNLVSSDVIKFFVDLLNVIVEISNAITPLGSIAIGGGIVAGIKNSDNIKKEIDSLLNAIDINKIINTSAYVGSDGLFDTGTLRAYKEQLEGLDEAQIKASLSSIGLSKEQRNQVLSYIATSDAAKTLTSAQILERLSTEMNSKANAEELLTRTGLFSAKELDTGATVVLTEAKKKEILTSTLLNAEEKKLILSLFGEGTAKTGVVAATWELVKANLALIAANPFTWIAGGIALALGLAAAFNHVSKAGERAREATEEAINNYEGISSEVDSVTSSIEELNKQISELNPITDSGDIKNLETEKGLLEAELAILKEKQRLAKEEADNAAQESLNTTQGSKYAIDDQLTYYGESVGYASIPTPKQVTQYEELDLAMDKYAEYQKELSDLQTKFKDMNEADEGYSKTAKRISDLGEMMKDVKSHANELAISIQEQVKGLSEDTEESKKLKDTISDVIYKYIDFTKVTDNSTKSLNKNAEAQQNVPKPSESELNQNVNNTFDTIKKSYNVLKEFEKAMSSGMTESALNGVAELSDELKVMVAGFHAGAVSADQLYKALTEHYQNDLKNYGEALIAKHHDDVEFCNAVGINSAEVTNQFLNDYGVDLSNHKTYASKKLEIENALLGKIKDNWAKYYNAQTKSFTSQMDSLNTQISHLEMQTSGGISHTGAIEALEALRQQRDDIYKYVGQYESAIDDLNNIVYKGLSSNFDTIGIGLNNKNTNTNSGSETEESFDWIQVKIERLEREITNLDKIVNATYKSWTYRNKALSDEISKVTDEIAVQEAGYTKYMSLANGVGLSEKYKKLVQSGAIDYTTLKDEKLIEKIQKYQEFYELALECKDATKDLQDDLAALAKLSFENVVAQYEEKLSVFEHEASVLDSYIDQVEARGHIVSKSYYEELMKVEKNNLATLRSEYSSLQSSLEKAMADGNIEEGSSDWYDMMNQINDVENAIIESNTALVEFQKNIRDLEWESFDRLEDMISQITEEADYLIDLLSRKDLFDEKGNVTEQGEAVFGLHAVNYGVYKEQARDYADEIEDINKELAKDPYNEELLERREELIQSHRDMITSAEDEKQAMIDLAEEGYNKMLDYLNELIDKRKEALQIEKDMYDYEKNIRKQTEEIARLEKIGNSINNDTSEEGQLRAQQNATALKEAREALEESEYDKYISDQEQMLDTLASETEEWISQRLENTDQLLRDITGATNTNSSSILETLERETKSLGTSLSEEMSNVWKADGSAREVVSTYTQGISDNLTGVIGVLERIEGFVKSMTDASDKEANADINGASNNSPATSPGGGSAGGSGSSASSTSSSSTTNKNTSSSSSNSSSTSSKSDSNWGSWFINKKDNYPKSKLNTETSVIDRLKSQDFDSSFTARAKYYAAMGLGSASSYTGSAKQNQSMIAEMKKHGFHSGGRIGSIIRSTGEDGFVLAKEGEYIFTERQFKELGDMMSIAEPFIKSAMQLPVNSGSYNNNISNDIKLNIQMYGIQDVDSFVGELKSNRGFEKLVQTMTIGRISGANSLSKYKY